MAAEMKQSLADIYEILLIGATGYSVLTGSLETDRPR